MASSPYVPAAEIVRRLKLSMPVHLDGLTDPLGNEFSIHRDNLMTLLTTDLDALSLDSQSIAPFYMEMARAQRSCEWAADHLDTRYVRWKAQRAEELRSKSEKRPTVAEVENFYRNHDDYEDMANGPKALRTLAALFGDAKNAFLMKARAQESQSRMTAGFERAIRYDDQESRLGDLENEAERVFAASDSASAAANYVNSLKE